MDILTKELIKIGGQFSGVGAFDFALDRLGIEYENVYQAEWDKYARQTYLENHSKPKWYVEDVYDTPINDIPSLDIAMFSPPCQAFSLAGKRKGEDDKRGVLFYNSHEFIQKNNPRYFIFENVKGLLSDDNGKTFQKWIDLLAGKSVNGNPVIFPNDDSVPYHVYYQVLNAKDYGVPQNRERIFIIGIRDDADNNFSFPKPFHLTKRLKDVLETDVDEKYFLSDKMIEGLINTEHLNSDRINNTLRSSGHQSISKKHSFDVVKVGFINQDTQASQVMSEEGTVPNICAGTHGYANGYVQIGAIRGRNPEEPKSRVSGLPTEQRLELNINGTSNALTTVQKDNVVIIDDLYNNRDEREYNDFSPTLRAEKCGSLKTYTNYKIRRLTPRECFRLMDFPDSFNWSVSDTQAYKQAGNSIVVNVLAQIIKKLNLTK